MPLVRPEGSISLTWDTLGMCFIHSEFYMVPFNIAHDMSPAGLMYGFVSPINLHVIMVVVMRFFTDYKSDMGKLVMVPSRMAERDLNVLFLLDFASSFPWEWLPMRTKFG